MNLKVTEIFYSLQGEGGRSGHPSIFIRLTGCSAKHACYEYGVRCDTQFETGKDFTLEELHKAIKQFPCKWIVWSGGEPCDQLTLECVNYFKLAGYSQAIETSGLHPVPAGIDWVTVSPKVADHVIAKNFPLGVTELKYVYHKQKFGAPKPPVPYKHLFISPMFNGDEPDFETINHCIKICLENPDCCLTLQTHKLLKII